MFWSLTLALSLLQASPQRAAADGLFEAGRCAEAVPAYRQLLRTEPENASLLGRVGQCLISMGDMAEAISVLTRAADAGADRKTVQLLATLLYRGGYYAGAVPIFERLIAPGTASPAEAGMYAVSLLKSGNVEKGEAEARRLLQRKSADIDLVLTLAESLFERGQTPEALKLVDQSLASWPNHPIPYYWRARILLRERKLDDAEEAANKAVALAPAIPFARDLLVRIYTLQGRREEAAHQAAWLRDYEDRRMKARAQ